MRGPQRATIAPLHARTALTPPARIFRWGRVFSFQLDAVAVLPYRIELPDDGGGGWELAADEFALRVDFNQEGFTLHQQQLESGAAAAAAPAASQGSQGDPAPPVVHTAPVDVMYKNIRCIKRGASARVALAARTRLLLRMLL